MTKLSCIVCEQPITSKRGQSIDRCVICNNPVCNSHLYQCGKCERYVCINDFVNWRPDMRKTSEWNSLRCKECARRLKQIGDI